MSATSETERETYDFNDPLDVSLFAQRLANLFIQGTCPAVVRMPQASRQAFFGAYVGILSGAMYGTIGADATIDILDGVKDALRSVAEKQRARLH